MPERSTFRVSMFQGTLRWQRIVSQAIVIAIHVALLVFLSIPPAPQTAPVSARGLSQSISVMHVRLIEVAPEPQSLPPAPVPPPQRRMARFEESVSGAPSPEMLSTTVVTAMPPRKPVNVLQSTVVPPFGAQSTFTVGRGSAMHSDVEPPHIRLPGGRHVLGAPHFKMVDPRSRGVAGVIHFIGGLTGAVDSHCLDLDAWRGMTTKERLAHGVTLGDIQEIEDNYNCATPPRHRGRS